MADDGKDHGDDHDPKDEGFDPWADLDAEGSSEPGEGFSFSVDDIGLDAALDADLDVPPAEASAENVTVDAAFLADGPHESEFVAAEEEVVVDRPAEEPADDDAFVNAWLTETDEEPASVTPLSVFSPDDHADLGEPETDAAEPAWPHDPAAIEIGTGQSGVTSASDIEAIGFGEEPVVEDANAAPVEADIIDFGAAAGAAAVAAASAAGGSSEPVPPPGSSVAAKPRSRSGLGQLIGVVLGGLMAIPVVLGILIGLMWLGWKDTVGIRQWWPKQAAFLLPPSGTRVGAGGGATQAGAPSLDDLPAADITAAVTEDPPPAPAAAEPAADETTPVVAAEPVADEPAPMPEPLAAVPAEPAPPPMPDPVSPPVVVDEPPATAAPAPALDALAAVAPPQPAPVPAAEPSSVGVVEPEPLDLGGLEAAVADATAAFDAVQAVVDPSDPARRTLLVDWYKQLARVAQELAMLERVAADSGRPLVETPAVAADLGGRVLAAPQLADDLARLARNWLTYSRREGDGVVMPATFSAARRVGPYWCSRVAIAEAGGASRELSVISRQEPAAVPGDAVVIMGLVMDGGVLWASDVRTAAAVAPAAAVEPDPFGQPGL